MNAMLNLDEKELAVILALLEAERRELPSEIRHSERSRFRDELHERKTVVDGLVKKLDAMAHPEPV